MTINRLPSLSNRYFVMRHGQSEANAAGLIVSHAENGVGAYGLTEAGRHQVGNSIRQSRLGRSTRIICSDFKRARDSAEIAHVLLGCENPIDSEIRLRERYFGDFELASDQFYQQVWDLDVLHPPETKYHVETVYSVLQRAVAVVSDCERRWHGDTCLLVAHGDILQILQTAFYRLPPGRHRDLPHLDTAEVRELHPVPR